MTMRKRFSARTMLGICLAAVVITVVVISVSLLDSPAQQRLVRLDERRVADLRELSYAVDAFWTRVGRLPESLDELAAQEGIVSELGDPETGEPYEYRPGSGSNYELCAIFDRETDVGERDFPYGYVWTHGVGRQCFQLRPQNVDRGFDR